MGTCSYRCSSSFTLLFTLVLRTSQASRAMLCPWLQNYYPFVNSHLQRPGIAAVSTPLIARGFGASARADWLDRLGMAHTRNALTPAAAEGRFTVNAQVCSGCQNSCRMKLHLHQVVPFVCTGLCIGLEVLQLASCRIYVLIHVVSLRWLQALAVRGYTLWRLLRRLELENVDSPSLAWLAYALHAAPRQAGASAMCGGREGPVTSVLPPRHARTSLTAVRCSLAFISDLCGSFQCVRADTDSHLVVCHARNSGQLLAGTRDIPAISSQICWMWPVACASL